MCSITENYYALCSCALTGAILSSETIAKCTNILISLPQNPLPKQEEVIFQNSYEKNITTTIYEKMQHFFGL